jgi:hypothetical protein
MRWFLSSEARQRIVKFTGNVQIPAPTTHLYQEEIQLQTTEGVENIRAGDLSQ